MDNNLLYDAPPQAFLGIGAGVYATTESIIFFFVKADGSLHTDFSADMHSRTMPGFAFSTDRITSWKIGISSSSYSIGVVQDEPRSRKLAQRHRMSL